MLGSPTTDFFPHKHLFLNYSKNVTALESKNWKKNYILLSYISFADLSEQVLRCI